MTTMLSTASHVIPHTDHFVHNTMSVTYLRKSNSNQDLVTCLQEILPDLELHAGSNNTDISFSINNLKARARARALKFGIESLPNEEISELSSAMYYKQIKSIIKPAE